VRAMRALTFDLLKSGAKRMQLLLLLLAAACCCLLLLLLLLAAAAAAAAAAAMNECCCCCCCCCLLLICCCSCCYCRRTENTENFTNKNSHRTGQSQVGSRQGDGHRSSQPASWTDDFNSGKLYPLHESLAARAAGLEERLSLSSVGPENCVVTSFTGSRTLLLLLNAPCRACVLNT